MNIVLDLLKYGLIVFNIKWLNAQSKVTFLNAF